MINFLGHWRKSRLFIEVLCWINSRNLVSFIKKRYFGSVDKIFIAIYNQPINRYCVPGIKNYENGN